MANDTHHDDIGPVTPFEEAVAAGEHLAYVEHDVVNDLRGEPSWYFVCSCSEFWDAPPNPAHRLEADARADGGSHLWQHGGRWDSTPEGTS